jgi:hypothetical protein
MAERIPMGKERVQVMRVPKTKKRETVEKSFPDLFKHRLVVLPGDGLACKEIPIKISVLDVQWFIQMEFIAEALHHLRGELGVEGVHLTGLPRCQMDDQERDNGDKEQGNNLLYDAPTDE